MPQGSSARFWLLGAAIAAAVGCAGKDKDKPEAGLGKMDPQTKAKLFGPPSADLPRPKFDPSMTGADGLKKVNLFDRKTPVTIPGSPTQPTNPSVTPLKPVEVASSYQGPLPKPNDVLPVAATAPVILSNPTPPEMPAPLTPAPLAPPPLIVPGPMLNPVPPLPPAGLPVVAPTDTGLLPVPSISEKPLPEFPIAPSIVK